MEKLRSGLSASGMVNLRDVADWQVQGALEKNKEGKVIRFGGDVSFLENFFQEDPDVLFEKGLALARNCVSSRSGLILEFFDQEKCRAKASFSQGMAYFRHLEFNNSCLFLTHSLRENEKEGKESDRYDDRCRQWEFVYSFPSFFHGGDRRVLFSTPVEEGLFQCAHIVFPDSEPVILNKIEKHSVEMNGKTVEIPEKPIKDFSFLMTSKERCSVYALTADGGVYLFEIDAAGRIKCTDKKFPEKVNCLVAVKQSSNDQTLVLFGTADGLYDDSQTLVARTSGMNILDLVKVNETMLVMRTTDRVYKLNCPKDMQVELGQLYWETKEDGELLPNYTSMVPVMKEGTLKAIVFSLWRREEVSVVHETLVLPIIDKGDELIYRLPQLEYSM